MYQITDHPELISAGRHWTFHPERAAISQQPIPKVPGTPFRFPWATREHALRHEMGVAEVTDQTPGELLGVLDETLPLAILFLKKVEVIRFGAASRRACVRFAG